MGLFVVVGFLVVVVVVVALVVVVVVVVVVGWVAVVVVVVVVVVVGCVVVVLVVVVVGRVVLLFEFSFIVGVSGTGKMETEITGKHFILHTLKKKIIHPNKHEAIILNKTQLK